jgi:DNA polymerase-3 subunit gamma/tau
MAGGIALAQPAPAAAHPKSYRDVVALVAAEREVLLHGHLLHSVHLVRFAPPVIELRPQPDAPRDLAPRLGALLQKATGTRWTIALSTSEGAPTLAEQGTEADRNRRAAAAGHPLVQAILEAFPGARIEAVRDPGADAYGLPAGIALDDPAPIDPEEPADLMDVPIEADPRFLTETTR